MDAEDLHPWYYPVTIDGREVEPGVGSRHAADELRARMAYRRDLLVEQVSARYSFEGKSLLDVGCNCGYWSSLYVQRGALEFVGLEGRRRFVEQGELYWGRREFLPQEDWRFICGDVTSEAVQSRAQRAGFYDFVLCAGILYHVADPLALLDWALAMAREAVLIDTRVSPPGHKKTQGFRERGDWSFDAIPESRIARHPMLDDLLRACRDGFKVIRLRPRLLLPVKMRGNDNYDDGRRVTLLATRREAS